MANKPNPIFKDLNLTFALSFLLNKDLIFSLKEKQIIQDYINKQNTNQRILPLYLIYSHPDFGQKYLNNKCIINAHFIDELLSNYEKRAEIRKLIKSPFI